jgi:hypothetical protein
MKASVPLAGGTENAALDSFAFAGDRRYCAPSLYGKAKRDIDPWHPNLCFKLPFSELTSSCQHRLMEKPRLELKFKQWCAAGSTCFAPNVYSRFAERRAGEACIPEVHESDFSPV